MSAESPSLLQRLDSIGRALENIALVGFLSLMMVLGVAQIVLREVFNTSIIWADEFSRLAVLWLAMVAAIAAARENRHIRIDALSHILPASVLRVTRVIVDLFAAGVCAALAWYCYQNLLFEIEFEETVLRDFPAWIAHSIVPVAFLLTAYRFAVDAIKVALNPAAAVEERATL